MFEGFSFGGAESGRDSYGCKQSSTWREGTTTTSTTSTTTTTTTETLMETDPSPQPAATTTLPWTPADSLSLSSDSEPVSPFHSRPASPHPSRHRDRGISIDTLAHCLSAHTLLSRPHHHPPTPPYTEADGDYNHHQRPRSPAHSTPQETARRLALRSRRQANVRLQCDDAHRAAIARLVEDLVQRGSCQVSPPPPPPSRGNAHGDEGYGDGEVEGDEDRERLRKVTRRRSSRVGGTGESMRERCGVVKPVASAAAAASGGGLGPATHEGGLRGVYGRARDASRARRTRKQSLVRGVGVRS